MEIKDLLKARRLEKNLTLDEVAHMVGVSAPTISRRESGDIANMRRDKIVKLAQALDMPPAVIMGYENVMAEFKYIIFSLRNSKGFNQEQMAQELHVSKATIGMWEIGERKPSPDKYEEIADYFNVDMDYIYGRSSIPRKIVYDSSGQTHRVFDALDLTEHELGLIQNYRKSSDETRHIVDLILNIEKTNLPPHRKEKERV